MKKSLYRTVSGFTLLELILVILIVGIISTMVLPRWPATSLNLEHEARRVLNDIRYAQALSLTTGERYRWVSVSSTAYQITNAAGTAIVLPMGGTQMNLSSGITFGGFSNLPNNLIAFDSQGTPYITSSSPGTALSSTASIPIQSGGESRTIQISPGTGYGVLQ